MSSAATAVQQRTAPGVQTVILFLELIVFVGLGLGHLGLFAYVTGAGYHAFDFQTFWKSGHAVLHGHSPYPHSLPAHAHKHTFRPFVYPAPAALAMVPFALLPLAVANIIWAVLGAAAVGISLRLLGVRDWRCYGAVFAWPVVWSSIVNGAISALLVLGCAAIWRYRDRAVVAGILVASVVVLKLYLWPLGIWLLATRRWRASAVAVVVGAVGTAVSWALIGWQGLGEYPRLLGRLTSLVADDSYSPYALLRRFGASPRLAEILVFGLGALVLALAVYIARRDTGHAAAFVLTIAAALAMTPIAWPHYFALTCIAVALARRDLGAAWVLPMTALLPAWSGGHPLLIGPVLLFFAAIFAWSARSLVGSAGNAAKTSRFPSSPAAARP